MRGRCDVRYFLEPLDVLRAAAKLVVADQHAVRAAAESSVLFLVDFLELDALIELNSALQVLLNLVLPGVQKTKLQHGARLSTHDKVVKSAPRSFELAKVLV